MNAQITDDEQQAVDQALVERADYIPLDELLTGTATNDFFGSIHKSLVSRGTSLLIGPRGCGKTHMMRYTWLLCKNDSKLPLAVYASFNRYYRLEPFLKSRTDAYELFHSWVLSCILRAVYEVGNELIDATKAQGIIGVELSVLNSIISRLERGIPLSADELLISQSLSIDGVVSVVSKVCEVAGRKRAVVLLDDAALTLTPEYLREFFDIVRALRTQKLAPKASVYPGTDFGEKFHAHHEADQVSAWLSVDDSSYTQVMDEIAARRSPASGTSSDVTELLKFAAFGIPRAFLTMLREYGRLTSSGAQRQQALNKVIEDHVQARRAEYNSLQIKMPRFDTIIRTGEMLFNAMVREIKQANPPDSEEKQLLVGLPDDDVMLNPLRERMVKLLIEAGLIYPHQSVSHGEDRTYQRYAPHIAALLAERTFSASSRGASTKAIVERLRAKPAKHPVRRSLHRLLSQDVLRELKMDLPPCRKCLTPRLTDTQRFCHACGSQLLDESTFTKCMALPIKEVPGLTPWQRDKIAALPRVRTIGDLLAAQDPGTELRSIPWVGTKRANRIIALVTSHVDEFLS